MKKVIILLYIACISSWLHAQSIQTPTIIPPSQVAQAFMRYGEIPVDYSTGIPNIEIPIYTLEGNKLKVPVSISYHASGIKVQDVASEVGLGWVLNCGGMVSRTVLGIPDEARTAPRVFETAQELLDSVNDAVPIYSSSCNCYQGMINFEDFFRLGMNTQDPMSDRFSYRLTNGHSGIFRYDYLNGNNLITLPHQPIKVERNISNLKIDSLKITDENGIVYVFKPCVSGNIGSYSEWYLRRMISADGTDAINFYYSPQTAHSSIPIVSYILTGPAENYGTCNPGGSSSSILSQATTVAACFNTPKLDSVVSSTAVIKFQYSARSDFAYLYQLNNISISPRNSTTNIKSARLVHKYFGSATNNYRLALDSVIISATGETKPQKYSFQYEGQMLPPYPYKMSSPTYGEDFWGYYNGATSPTLIASDLISDSGDRTSYGANRYADGGYFAKACMLKAIKYPTGGKTVFQFERNYDTGVYAFNSNNQAGYVGCFRVKAIKDVNENNDTVSVKTYEYWGAKVKTITEDLFRYIQQVSKYVLYTDPEGWSTDCRSHYTKEMLFSDPFLPLEVGAGLPVMYTTVIEYNGNKTNNSGKTVYKYNEPYSPSDFIYNSEHPYQWEEPWYYYSFHYDKGYYAPELISKTDYSFDGTNYHPVSKVQNKYNKLFTKEFQAGIKLSRPLQFPDITDVSGILYWNDPVQDYISSIVAIDTKAYQESSLITKSKTYTYDPLDSTKYVVGVSSFEYDSSYVQMMKQTDSTSIAGTKVTEFKYPFSYPGITPYNDMITKYMVSPIVESKVTNGTAIEKINTNYYNPSGSIYVPQTVQQTIGTTVTTKLTYNSYDEKGNVTQYTGADGIVTTIVWGYKKIYPVAKIVSGASISVSTTIINNINNHSFSGTDIKSQVDSDISFLAQQLSTYIGNNNYQVSLYTYKPLVGLTSETTANGNSSDPGNTTYYIYDYSGRLKEIRDDDNRLLKKYTYNYASN